VRAHNYWGEQKLDKALQDFGKTIELGWTHGGYLNRSELYLLLNQVSNALADANRAIELRPQQAEGYALRARIFQLSGDKKNAARDLSTVAEINSKVLIKKS
jgi:tetratricopeptide (TPR) repeat protein